MTRAADPQTLPSGQPHGAATILPLKVPLGTKKALSRDRMAAFPEHVFAMKALAARTCDVNDLRLLASMIGIETADAALQICADFYPDEPIPPRTDAVLRELFS